MSLWPFLQPLYHILQAFCSAGSTVSHKACIRVRFFINTEKIWKFAYLTWSSTLVLWTQVKTDWPNLMESNLIILDYTWSELLTCLSRLWTRHGLSGSLRSNQYQLLSQRQSCSFICWHSGWPDRNQSLIFIPTGQQRQKVLNAPFVTLEDPVSPSMSSGVTVTVWCCCVRVTWTMLWFLCLCECWQFFVILWHACVVKHWIMWFYSCYVLLCVFSPVATSLTMIITEKSSTIGKRKNVVFTAILVCGGLIMMMNDNDELLMMIIIIMNLICTV